MGKRGRLIGVLNLPTFLLFTTFYAACFAFLTFASNINEARRDRRPPISSFAPIAALAIVSNRVVGAIGVGLSLARRLQAGKTA